MAIEFACPLCAANLKAPESQGGKRGKCSACGAKIDVPRFAAAAVAGDQFSGLEMAAPALVPPRAVVLHNGQPPRPRKPFRLVTIFWGLLFLASLGLLIPVLFPRGASGDLFTIVRSGVLIVAGYVVVRAIDQLTR